MADQKRRRYQNPVVRWSALLILVCLAGGSAFARPGVRIFAVKSKDITSYNLALEGFRQQISQDSTVIEFDLAGSLDNAQKMVEELEKQSPNLILAVGAKAIMALSQARVTQPVVFCMVMNPDWYPLENLNATGVSLAVPPDEQLEVLKTLNPQIKKIGLLLRKEATPDLLRRVKSFATRKKLELIPVELANEKEIPRKMREVIGKIDALWMLDDAYIHSADTLRFVVLQTLENGLPFMAISEVFVKEGALLSLSPSFFSNGKQAARLAERIITGKLRPKDIPVSFHQKSELILNLKIARKIGLTISSELRDRTKRVYE